MSTLRSIETQRAYNEFRKNGGNDTCPLCAKFNNSISSNFLVVANDFPYERFEDFPVVEHLLLVSHRHIESLSELSKTELNQWATIIAQAEGDGYEVLARPSGAPTKSQYHLHTHLVKIADAPRP